MIAEGLAHLAVPASSLEYYRRNARIGNVATIVESLQHRGQVRPITVNRRTNEVLAGNHTLKAIRQLKWREVAVQFIDVDDQTAAKIAALDNRSSDLSLWDEPRVVALLQSFNGDLAGTGWTEPDFARILARTEAVDSFADPLEQAPSGKERVGRHDLTPGIMVDRYSIACEAVDFMTWADALVVHVGHEGITDELHRRLLLPHPTPAASGPARPKKQRKSGGTPSSAGEQVPLDQLNVYHAAGRIGVVDRIAEGLNEVGQYRAITANRRTGEVLAGNNVLLAARYLGWETLDVVWVDLDEQEAARMYLHLNKSEDDGTYDSSKLAELVEFAGVSATGFSSAEWVGLMQDAGRLERQRDQEAIRHIRIKYGAGNISWRASTTVSLFEPWLETVVREGRYADDGVADVILRRLDLRS